MVYSIGCVLWDGLRLYGSWFVFLYVYLFVVLFWLWLTHNESVSVSGFSV